MKPVPHLIEPEGVPACQLVAEVIRFPNYCEVRLPARFAVPAMTRYLERHHFGYCLSAPNPTLGVTDIPDGWWMLWVGLGSSHSAFVRPKPQGFGHDGFYLFPKNVVFVVHQEVARVLGCLEWVKPFEQDASGCQYPWVPKAPSPTVFSGRSHDEEDVVVGIKPGEEQESSTEDSPAGAISSEQIRQFWSDLAVFAGYPADTRLDLVRGRDHRNGFVTGRVWLNAAMRMVRVRIVTCPNADEAEILGTMVHELAHAVGGWKNHNADFKTGLVDLASRRWGAQWFVEARRRIPGPYPIVDLWVVSGIRAALRQAEPPVSRVTDAGQMARAMSKIRKLRELGRDQMGRPEGILATSTANDLALLHGLEAYSMRMDSDSDDQMMDRWYLLEDESIWRSTLMFAVARFCDLQALYSRSKRQMHLFGRYSDIVAAEYLYGVSAERIVRESEQYIMQLRLKGPLSSGESRRERVSFCDSATRGFVRKLNEILESMPAQGEGGKRLNEAKEFSERELEKRGINVRKSKGKAIRLNAQGERLGRSMEVVRGVSRTGGDQKRLT